MAAPLLPLIAASTAVKTIGGVVSGLGAASAASGQAKVADANAAIASAQAGQREDQIRRQGRQTLGEQVAGLAENGAGFTQSARDTMDQSAANLSLDALNARYGGAIERTNDMNDAAQLRAKAKATRISTAIGAGSDLLSGVADYAGAGGKFSNLFGG